MGQRTKKLMTMPCVPEVMLTDYMCLEERDEEDLLASAEED